MRNFLFTILILFTTCILSATTFHGTPDNYLSFITQLQAGDSLILATGNYLNRLNLDDLVGTENEPIVITAAEDANVILLGNACCNTVSIERCAWLTISNLTIDGQNIPYIDAVKAEGTSGNWAHHITIENLLIINHGGAALTVGISTKCPAWNWVIKHNTIIEAGIGMYLGNSDGEKPFVNGIIEYNLIVNTQRYGLQIKHQNVGSRNIPGMVLNGKTIIRYNVISRAAGYDPNTPRPNLLVGAFPATGNGQDDYYEIYGNFLWQNPNEGLFQGTGNYAFYNNVLVNHHSTGWGIAVNNHNNFKPRNVHIFNNTILTNSSGIDFYQADPAYQQLVINNAIFAPDPILDALDGVVMDNITDSYANAFNYIQNPSITIDLLDMTPKTGMLQGATLAIPQIENYEDVMLDFDGNHRDWSFKGAYSSIDPPLWDLALEIRREVLGENPNFILEYAADDINVFPNPTNNTLFLSTNGLAITQVNVFDVNGKIVLSPVVQEGITSLNMNFSPLVKGIYFVQIQIKSQIFIKKVFRI